METAKEYFLRDGFTKTSLRKIVKKSGVTTGAFYGYFVSKEELFEELVERHYQYFTKSYKKVVSDFMAMEPSMQEEKLYTQSNNWMMFMLEYIYVYLDEFRLLISCAEGTKYENFIHDLVEIEVQSTEDTLAILRKNKPEVPMLNLKLEHILASGMFNAFFEIIVHNYSKEEAKECTQLLVAFQVAGWKAILEIQ